MATRTAKEASVWMVIGLSVAFLLKVLLVGKFKIRVRLRRIKFIAHILHDGSPLGYPFTLLSGLRQDKNESLRKIIYASKGLTVLRLA